MSISPSEYLFLQTVIQIIQKNGGNNINSKNGGGICPSGDDETGINSASQGADDNKKKYIEPLEPALDDHGNAQCLCREGHGRNAVPFNVNPRRFPPYQEEGMLKLCPYETALELGAPELPPNTTIWRYPVAKPIKNLDIKGLYLEIYKLAKDVLVFSEEIEYKIFTLWLISTWKLGCWKSVGFPMFIGPPESGKSTCLSFLNQLAYRAVKISGSTDMVMPRLCDQWNATLLFDEAHNDFKNGMKYKFAKDSYKIDGRYLKCNNKSETGVISLSNFGFKVFAGETSENFDEAIKSRCIIFMMSNGKPKHKLEDMVAKFSTLRTELLNYRYTYPNPDKIYNNCYLDGRLYEIYSPILRTCSQMQMPKFDVIKFAIGINKIQKNWLKDTKEFQVLSVLLYQKKVAKPIDIFSDPSVDLLTVLYSLNWIQRRQETSTSPTWHKKYADEARELGKTLSRLGLKSSRTNGVRYFVFDKRNMYILRRLWAEYDVKISGNRFFGLDSFEDR